MKVWVDITESSHVLFYAPIIRRLEEQGHIVTLTARRFAQTELLLRRFGLIAVISGQERGKGFVARAFSLASRTAYLIASARQGGIDVAVGHDANDLAMAAYTLGIPQLSILADERPNRARHLHLRLVNEVAVPEAIPLERLLHLGVNPERVRRFPGHEEEYYLYDFEPEPDVLERIGASPRRVIGVVRPANAALPHYSEQAANLDRLLTDLSAKRDVTLIVIARSEEQRAHFHSLGLRNLLVADASIDGLSLIAAADFMVGAGGAMMREAAALGTPTYTLLQEQPGAVEARLLTEGRLRRATTAADVKIKKKDVRTATTAARDPQLFVDAIVSLARRPRRPLLV